MALSPCVIICKQTPVQPSRLSVQTAVANKPLSNVSRLSCPIQPIPLDYITHLQKGNDNNVHVIQ